MSVEPKVKFDTTVKRNKKKWVSRITNEPYEEKLKKALQKYCTIKERNLLSNSYGRNYQP